MARQLRKPGGAMGHKVGLMMNKANAFLYDFTLHTMQLSSGDAVLEIGFGNGMFFEKIFSKTSDLKITGLDFSAKMLKEAQENNQQLINTGKLNLAAGSSSQMPFGDNSFDKIFCINVIYFWDEPLQHLQEIKRVLKRGGKFFATFRTKESMEKMPFTKYGFTSYTENSWKALVEQSGLQLHQALLTDEPEANFKGNSFRVQSYCLVAIKNQL